MRLIRTLILSAAALTSSVANATPDQSAPLPKEIRLSDEEKEKVLEAAADSKRDRPAAISAGDSPQPPQIHGEVGLTIGTGGYRSLDGTALVPFDGGFAAITFDTTDFGEKSHYLRPWIR